MNVKCASGIRQIRWYLQVRGLPQAERCSKTLPPDFAVISIHAGRRARKKGYVLSKFWRQKDSKNRQIVREGDGEKASSKVAFS